MSIRYTLKSLIPYGKTAKPLKIAQFSAGNHGFLMEVALDIISHQILLKSHGNNPIFLKKF